MRRTSAVLIVLLLGNLLAACTSGGTWQPAPPTPADPVIGRWEIIPGTYAQYNDKNTGWKYIRVPISIENRTNRATHAKIPVSGSQIFAAQTTVTGTIASDYPAELWETKGFSLVRTNEIDYTGASPVPPGLRIAGAYISDAVSTYFFQARIPLSTQPDNLTIPGYPDHFSLRPNPVQAAPISSNPLRVLNQMVPVSGKANLVVTAIRPAQQPDVSSNQVAHDRITISFIMTSINGAHDSNVDLRAVAIGERGILGSPFFDEVIGCNKPPFTIGPSMTITGTLCTIIPFQSKNVRVILTGDVSEVYAAGF